VDLHAHQFGQLHAGRFANRLDPCAAFAKHNRALGWSGDKDLLVDFQRSVFALAIFLGLDGAGIRQLFMELEIELLSRDFRRD